MKSVAIVGFSVSTREQVFQSSADELWSVNWAWQYNFPRIDRLFDLHPRWYLTQPNSTNMVEHWEWLQREHQFPIYMIEDYPEVPNCVLYPKDAVIADIGREYFTSSISYLLALALLEKFNRIEIYGVDMDTSTEYAYQKAGATYLIGVADGRGVDVYIPEESKLMRPVLYGYDGGFQMISRQTLEKIKANFELQFHQNVEVLNKYQGALELLELQANQEKNQNRKKHLIEQQRNAYQNFIEAKDNVLASDVSVQVMNHLIDNVDVKAPDLKIKSNINVKVREE